MSSSSGPYHCDMLEPEEGKEGSDSMCGIHFGSLAWGVGAQASIRGRRSDGKQQQQKTGYIQVGLVK